MCTSHDFFPLELHQVSFAAFVVFWARQCMMIMSGAINGHMSIFLQFSVKIIQPIRHCKASKGGLFYVKPPSSLHNLNLAKREEAMFNDSAVNEKKEGRTCVKLA